MSNTGAMPDVGQSFMKISGLGAIYLEELRHRAVRS